MFVALILGLSACAYLVVGTDMSRLWKALALALGAIVVSSVFTPGLLEIPAPFPTLCLAFLGIWGGFKLKLDGV